MVIGLVGTPSALDAVSYPAPDLETSDPAPVSKPPSAIQHRSIVNDGCLVHHVSLRRHRYANGYHTLPPPRRPQRSARWPRGRLTSWRDGFCNASLFAASILPLDGLRCEGPGFESGVDKSKKPRLYCFTHPIGAGAGRDSDPQPQAVKSHPVSGRK